MSTTLTEQSLKTMPGQLRDSFAEDTGYQEEHVIRTLGIIEEALGLESEYLEWVQARAKRKATAFGYDLEDTLIKPFSGVSIVGHNVGRNRLLHISILASSTKQGPDWSTPCACVTISRFWYQTDFNSGTHWEQILAVSSRGRVGVPSRHARDNETDSSWLVRLCEKLRTVEDARQFLRENREYTEARIQLHGDNT